MSTQVISFNCILRNKAGQLISSTYNREVLNTPQSREMELAGLSRAMQNLSKGEKRSVELRAEDAYGLYRPQKIILFPRKRIPKRVQVGEFISIVNKYGKLRSYKVLEFHETTVSLDGNHPLAGQDLIFEIETLDARDATPEEIEQSTNHVTTQTLH